MNLIIPSIGTLLRLTAPWTFLLHNEYRNKPLIKALGYTMKGSRYGQDKDTRSTMLPKGTVLVVDRIYIRQQAADFDSVTFRIRDWPGKKMKKVRFWAKLDDVNSIQCDIDPATTPGMIGPSLFGAAAPQVRPGATKSYKVGDRVVISGMKTAGVGRVIHIAPNFRTDITYFVALPTKTPKVKIVQTYVDHDICPPFYGMACTRQQLRPASDAEVEASVLKMHKLRKRRVKTAETLLANYAEALNNPLSGPDLVLFNNRHKDGRLRNGFYPHTTDRPSYKFQQMQMAAKGVKAIALEIAVCIAQNQRFRATTATETEHKLMAAVQMGYLDPQDVLAEIRSWVVSEGTFNVMWKDGVPVPAADLE